MKKVFLLILVLFTFTACGKKDNLENYLKNDELKEAFQVVLEDRGLEDDWTFLRKQKFDDEEFYVFKDKENKIDIMRIEFEDDEYNFFIGYNIINYPDPDYEYEDYDILYVYKENNEWKIRYGGE